MNASDGGLDNSLDAVVGCVPNKGGAGDGVGFGADWKENPGVEGGNNVSGFVDGGCETGCCWNPNNGAGEAKDEGVLFPACG